jgi:hypothetical protein
MFSVAGEINFDGERIYSAAGEINFDGERIYSAAGEIDLLGERKLSAAGEIDLPGEKMLSAAGEIDLPARECFPPPEKFICWRENVFRCRRNRFAGERMYSAAGEINFLRRKRIVRLGTGRGATLEYWELEAPSGRPTQGGRAFNIAS